ncbi:hypothetical protein QFC22_005157 [Naganishia vaughanmartiniae]|uniref:Uncharacterized protein n=1 Tax=Naganishia vaughanmartiniae TaxID=1424756 RepID=A0ACC2WUW6_9TREE|nr:hypothetical protein QFC22_005157 [Naganishia vaughanmartiniae]
MLQQQQHSPPPASSSGDSASSTGTASSDKDRQNRARIQAYYVTHEPFQVAHLKKERQRVELETVRAEAAEVERGVAERKVAQSGIQEVEPVIESTINLASQQSNSTTPNPLEQVPPPFVLPDTTTNADPQPQAPPIATVGLPLIVSSSAESNDAPQVVNAPEHEQPTNEESSPAAPTNASTGSASSAGSASGGKSTSAESNTGAGAKLGGLLSNWAPGVALKRPLSMQRSLSGFFGLKPSGIAESTSTKTSREEEQAGGEGGRKMSRGSMTSDESSLLVADEGGKSGVVYCGVDGKRAFADVAAVAGGWNAGERRRRLPDGASGIVLHKDLWKLDQMSETCDLPECSTVFSFTNRRHHCRMCGQIFCTPHASYALDLWYPPTGTSEEGFRSGMTSRRGSADGPVEQQQGVPRSPNEADRAMQGSEVTASLLRLPARRNVGKDGVVKPSRVCVDCYDRVWNPGKLVAREKARRAVHGDDAVAISATGDVNDSDSQASHSGFSLVLDSKAAVNDRVLQRSRSSQGTGRRMFSAPTSPASTSPTTNQGNALDGAVVGLAMNNSVASLSRTGSRASSLAPPGAKQNRRSARNASAHGALSLPPLRPGSAASDSVTPRPMFSPTAEALNIHAQQRSSLSPNSSAGANGYFPAMPPPSKAFLPGEEPNQHVNGVLSNYPLAYKPAASSGSTVTSPFTSRPPSSADLSGMARRIAGQGTTRQVPAHMRIDLPNGGYAFDDPLSSKASSARLLTPEREWVPGAWGYARETYDPDVESETEDEDDDVREVDSVAKRAKSRLIVDGDIRLKTRASDPRQTATPGDHTASHVQSSTGTRLMPWSTF